MRYLLMLFLSFPAYAAVIDGAAKWNLEATFTAPGDITDKLVGFFTVQNNVITDYNLNWLHGLDRSLPWPYCGGSDPSRCNKADIISPTHLRFYYAGSPASETILNLFLSAPLDSAANTIQLSPTTDYAFSYAFEHLNFVSGSITDPPIKSAIPEPSIPGILGIGLYLWMIRRLLLANKQRNTVASQG